jgi:hypothetical protein
MRHMSVHFQIALDLWKSSGNVLTWLYKQSLADAPYVISSMSIKDGMNSGLAEKICASTFKNDIAHMTLEIANPKVLEVVRDIKVTFPDKLGTVGRNSKSETFDEEIKSKCFSGGAIGLFTGLSLISIVEIFYWVYRTIVDYFSR